MMEPLFINAERIRITDQIKDKFQLSVDIYSDEVIGLRVQEILIFDEKHVPFKRINGYLGLLVQDLKEGKTKSIADIKHEYDSNWKYNGTIPFIGVTTENGQIDTLSLTYFIPECIWYLYGDQQTLSLYVFDDEKKRKGIKIQFSNLQDYWHTVAWMSVATSFKKTTYYGIMKMLDDYWETCPVCIPSSHPRIIGNDLPGIQISLNRATIKVVSIELPIKMMELLQNGHGLKTLGDTFFHDCISLIYSIGSLKNKTYGIENIILEQYFKDNMQEEHLQRCKKEACKGFLDGQGEMLELLLSIKDKIEVDDLPIRIVNCYDAIFHYYGFLGFFEILEDEEIKNKVKSFIQNQYEYVKEHFDVPDDAFENRGYKLELCQNISHENKVRQTTSQIHIGKTSSTQTTTKNSDNSNVSLETIMHELNNLIGLQDIKHDVHELIDLVQVQKMRRQRGLKEIPVSLHLVFTGNPGTGKTTVARILAQLYKEIGILKKGQLVEVDRADLVAGYVGQTAIKTKEVIEKAMGGILFIDEAYTLIKEGNDFGQEVIDTLLKEMEDQRDDFIVVVAGYQELMEKFINSNPGLKSRFNKYFTFPDYTNEELWQIFQDICKGYDYNVTDEAAVVIKEIICKKKAEKAENFANAREIRNLFEKIVTKQATRVRKLADASDRDLTLITGEDIG